MVEFREIQHKYRSKNDTVLIVPFSDFHIGNKAADKSAIERTVKWIGEYADYWFGVGDYCDCIVPSMEEKRFDFEALDRELATPDEQYAWVREVLEPIKHKCLGLMQGNHDYVLYKRHGHNHVQELCDKLGVPYLGYSCFLRFRFARQKHRTTVNMFAHHGHYSGRTKGGKINKARTLDQIFDADIYCMAHVHDMNPDIRPFLKFDNHGNVIEDRKYYVLTGGYLRGYVNGVTTYVERGMFAPTQLGSMAIIMFPEKNRFPWVKIEEIWTQ